MRFSPLKEHSILLWNILLGKRNTWEVHRALESIYFDPKMAFPWACTVCCLSCRAGMQFNKCQKETFWGWNRSRTSAWRYWGVSSKTSINLGRLNILAEISKKNHCLAIFAKMVDLSDFAEIDMEPSFGWEEHMGGAESCLKQLFRP